MCGIFGSVGLAPDRQRIEIVAHRGPDGNGWQTFDSPIGKIALGHRRLSIIDLSDAGRQPMTHSASGVSIVFNGEIYNYRELRRELAARGETFQTDSDTEVLLRALVVWGPEGLSRLRGMFAFVTWDDKRKRLFAARDRFGIKPLYIARSANSIAFASEIKQLQGLPGFSGRMNLARVADFLLWGISDHTSETMFDGVTQLRAGEHITIETAAPSPYRAVTRRWYEPAISPNICTPDEAATRFKALLANSIDLHLRSDVPVGSCLSGGLDSSSIVCLMDRQLGSATGVNKVQTISACYLEKSVDEKRYIDEVVKHTAANPSFIWPRAEDVFQRASDITWHQDEPFGSTSIFAQWCVFEEARRKGVKVMLDGQGADEQLAGYVTGFPIHLLALLRSSEIIDFWQTMAWRQRLSGVPIHSQILEVAAKMLPTPMIARLHQLNRKYFQQDWISGSAMLHASQGDSALDTAIKARGLMPVRDLGTHCITMTLASNLQMLLHWEDRNSMAHGVEARVPFLDHPLVEFSLSLGSEHKIVAGQTKYVLRQSMREILPAAVRNRHDKLGFATPEQSWFRGPLRRLVEDGLEKTLHMYPDLLNANGTRRRANDMLEGRRPVEFWLWQVVNVGIWGDRFGVSM